MKKIFSIVIFQLILTSATLNAQDIDKNSTIKLFLSPSKITEENKDVLNTSQQDRLYRKITQVINKIGVAEIGYSTFLVSPKLDILSSDVNQAGITQIYMAECELSITIKRAAFTPNGGAIFNSMSKKIIGSGSSKSDAINNALNNISGDDKNIKSFFESTKQKIDEYYKAHCDDVIKEAEQALALKDYIKSISLYFSIPSNSTCYKKAFDASQKVYQTYIDDECEKKLVTLKSYIALAQTESTPEKNYYELAVDIIKDLSPSSIKCYAEAKLAIEKIEKRLSEKQKQEWDMVKKLSTDESEILKERYKAIGKINNSYQPLNNIIITK